LISEDDTMNRNGNRRRQAQNEAPIPNNAQLARRMRDMERRMTGYKTVPANNPPAFVQLPWNSFTYEKTQTAGQAGAAQITTVNDILVQIAAKVCLSTEPPTVANVRVKVQSCQVWCTVADTLLHPDMEVTFYELSGESSANQQQPRSTQRDLGTLNMPAKCGYTYPIADSREIIADDLTLLKVAKAQAIQAGSVLTTRVHVLWQSSPSEE